MNPAPGLGAIHTTDERDNQYATVTAPEALPASYRTDTSMFPVFMQGQRESCVSHMWARLMQIYWYKKTGKVINFSPRFFHAYTAPGMAASDGRDPRVVGNAAVNVGCCTTDLLPNDVTLDDATYSFVTITPEMLAEAAQYKIPAYSFPNVDSYSIRDAIYHRGAVGLLFQIGDEWWTAPNGTDSYAPADINPLRAPAVIVGQHEVTGEHWNTLDGIENSWSNTWNEAGYGEYNFSNYAPLQVICIDDPAIDFNPSPAAPTFQFNNNLFVGVKSNDVVHLQSVLGVSPVTGFFGVLTFAAVVKYQRSNGITPTGFVGPLTRASLNSRNV